MFIGLFVTKEPFSTLKSMIFMKFAYQKLSHFSQLNKVLKAAASHIIGFLLRDICVS
jgi:hypothetical protein